MGSVVGVTKWQLIYLAVFSVLVKASNEGLYPQNVNITVSINN